MTTMDGITFPARGTHFGSEFYTHCLASRWLAPKSNSDGRKLNSVCEDTFAALRYEVK
jgi:hypothetical protein